MTWIRLGDAARSVVAKARPPRREPSGRRARLAKADDALVAATAAQPHRRGERTTAGATPWQRLLRSGAIADPTGRFTPGQLEEAGLRFANARMHYLVAIGAPFGWANAPASGADIPVRVRDRWIADWADLLQTLSPTPVRVLIRAIEAHPEQEEREWPVEAVAAIQEALMAVALYHDTQVR
jgi:hypothetical protein